MAGEFRSIPKNGPVNLSSFNYTGSMNSVHSDHTATLLKDGRVLVTGGLAVLANETTSAEIYDPATGRFSVTGSMFDARFEHEAVALNNGMVLVEGGTPPATNCQVWNCSIPRAAGELAASPLRPA